REAGVMGSNAMTRQAATTTTSSGSKAKRSAPYRLIAMGPGSSAALRYPPAVVLLHRQRGEQSARLSRGTWRQWCWSHSGASDSPVDSDRARSKISTEREVPG